jgi:hypothetical protein
VALAPGRWYLGVFNVDLASTAYTILATEFPAYGTNVVITHYQVVSNSFCLTWTSMPGFPYYVQGKPDLNSTNWDAVSPALTATDVLTSYCVPLPSQYHFFRVSEGLASTNSAAAAKLTSNARDTNAMLPKQERPTKSPSAGLQPLRP